MADQPQVKDPLIEGKPTSKYMRLFRIAWMFELGTAILVIIVHWWAKRAGLDTSAWSWRLVPGILSIAGINMVAFALNDYFDREIDAQHPTAKLRNPLVTGEFSLSQARLVIGITAAVTCLLSLLVSPLALATNAAYMFIGGIYVAEPIRLKRRIGLDVISHMFTVFSYSYFFMTYNFFKWLDVDTILYINQVISSVMIQLSQELFDFDHDKLRETNTAIALGRKGTGIAIRGAHAAYFAVTIIGSISGMLPLWLTGYSLLFGIRLYSVFNSQSYEKILGVYRLGVLLWSVFLLIRHFVIN